MSQDHEHEECGCGEDCGCEETEVVEKVTDQLEELEAVDGCGCGCGCH